MKKIHKYLKLSATMVFVVALSTFFFTSPEVSAQTGDKNCEVDTSVVSCDDRLDSSGKVKDGIEGTGLWSILILTLNILIGVIGITALAGIVYGSVMYASAGGNQAQVVKAIEIIRNVVIGVIVFALMWSVLNFLIPGGVFAS